MFQNSGLVDFMSLKLSYYPELVKVFYCNLKIQDGIIMSEVHGISMVIDHSLLFSFYFFSGILLFSYLSKTIVFSFGGTRIIFILKKCVTIMRKIGV